MTLPDWMTPAPTPTPALTPTRIFDLRLRLRLTSIQIAAYLGVPIQTYRKWETGERIPTAAATRLIDIMEQIETHAPALHARLIAEVM